VAATMLAGCGEAENLEKQYDIVATYSERCEVAGKIKEAWLARKSEEKYREWREKENIDCSMVRLGG
jgi:hypothetical protein